MSFRQLLQNSPQILEFTQLCPGIAAGSPVPPNWESIAIQPLLIVVGVTGVGKSTTLDSLRSQGVDFTLLPNRRNLTDRLIIAQMQAAKGQQPHSIDRLERLNYTRRYRKQYPGGMAHILTQLWIDPAQTATRLIFDGLRGENEIRYAVQALPQAKFVVLDAPDEVRLLRLLHRQDPFDQLHKHSPSRVEDTCLAISPWVDFASLGVPEASSLFDADQEQLILSLVHQGSVTVEELRAKLKIVVEERRNYDPVATIATLRQLASERTLVIDTTTHSPQQAANLLLTFYADFLASCQLQPKLSPTLSHIHPIPNTERSTG
ncbi:MAG TPA: AAA family ATPase [Coleofasciculaceae cyanobacterium]